MIITIEGQCAFEDCVEGATRIACGRGDGGHASPDVYCDAHAEIVADEGYPEYVDSCPNCMCSFGVN